MVRHRPRTLLRATRRPSALPTLRPRGPPPRLVRAHARHSDARLELGPDDCGFTSRSSRFKREPGRWVVLSVSFALHPGDESAPVRYAELARALGVELGERAPPATVREAVLALRRGKGMVIDPADPDSVSAGS